MLSIPHRAGGRTIIRVQVLSRCLLTGKGYLAEIAKLYNAIVFRVVFEPLYVKRLVDDSKVLLLLADNTQRKTPVTLKLAIVG